MSFVIFSVTLILNESVYLKYYYCYYIDKDITYDAHGCEYSMVSTRKVESLFPSS